MHDRLPPGKRLLFGAAAVLVVLACAELLSALSLWAAYGHPILWRGLARARAEAMPDQAPGGPKGIAGEVLHPYLGYVQLGNRTKREEGFLGFWATSGALVGKRNPREFRVAVLGGSLAQEFAAQADTFASAIARSPAAAGRRVVIAPVALGGYKQPQQLFALLYLLAQGAEFDAVVNIDGFNEVALGPAENAPSGVDPAYPRNWYVRTSELEEISPRLGEIAYLQRMRGDRAASFSAFPLRYSFVANALWTAMDLRLQGRIKALRNQPLDQSQADYRTEFQRRGPLRLEERSMLEDLVALWSRSSSLIADVCVREGIAYLHVLQPNQYATPSKPMGAAERAIAIGDKQKYRQWAEQGYPLLQAEGAAIRAKGVAFTDLTGAFTGHPEAVYRDACCHLNPHGYGIIGEIVARDLLAAMAAR